MSDDLHPPSFASSSIQNPPCVLDLSTLFLALPCWGACQNSKYLTQIRPYPRTRLQLPELGSHVRLFYSIHVQCRWLLLAFAVISHSFHQWVGLSELTVECPPCPSHCTWRGAQSSVGGRSTHLSPRLKHLAFETIRFSGQVICLVFVQLIVIRERTPEEKQSLS